MSEFKVDSDAITKRIKQEIVFDVARSIVPATVGSFAELHDYVDANLYGGTEELLDSLTKEYGGQEAMNRHCDIMNPIMDAVDAWIKSGGLNVKGAVQ